MTAERARAYINKSRKESLPGILRDIDRTIYEQMFALNEFCVYHLSNIEVGLVERIKESLESRGFKVEFNSHQSIKHNQLYVICDIGISW